MEKTNKTAVGKKKKLKKISLAVLSALLVLAVVAGALWLILRLISPDDGVTYDDTRFFPADYEKNIFEDSEYMSLNRGIHYNRYGDECVLTEANIKELPSSAAFFYYYFDCIIRGDCTAYPSFYTDSCLNNEKFTCPESFTMQGLYDIYVNLFSVEPNEEDNSVTEIYEVSYRIFENNGTYRKDILPEETRTRVFELIIINGEAKINSVSYRQTIK